MQTEGGGGGDPTLNECNVHNVFTFGLKSENFKLLPDDFFSAVPKEIDYVSILL